ncbi:MAG: protein-L-isoaspartate(D-aspartate) O-methyltransferase [Bacteroidota bacterium]
MIDTFKHKGQRKRLIEQLAQRGITDEAVLEAMGAIPRHGFVESAFRDEAYEDKALPIHNDQTISQPFTVAFQTELLKLKPKMKVLEIGTGSGYQAAILAQMGMKVFSVERDRRLHLEAKSRLEDLELKVELFHGDGSKGWPEKMEFDRIIVTAASPSIPLPLKEQLKKNGRLVIPVGTLDKQKMTLVTRINKNEWREERLQAFRFVPLVGQYGFKE